MVHTGSDEEASRPSNAARSRTGALQRGKSGAVRMAMEAQVPILPVAVVNSPAVMKGGTMTRTPFSSTAGL